MASGEKYFLVVLEGEGRCPPYPCAKAVDKVMPEDRHRLYEILRVRLTADVAGNLELNGELQVCTSEARPGACLTRTTMVALPT